LESTLNIELCISQLTLIEGDYRLGFHVATDAYRETYLDVLSFTVGTLQNRGNPVPYAPQHRGFLELDFSLEMEMVPAVEKQFQ